MRHDRPKVLSSSIIQGVVGPRGDTGPAGPPGPPVSAVYNPHHVLLSASFILFLSLSHFTHLSVLPPGTPCDNGSASAYQGGQAEETKALR